MRSSLAVFLGLLPVAFAQDGPVDAGIAKDCTFWDTSVDALSNCAYFERNWFISHADFVDWNPSVKQDCSGIKVGHSYCVEVNNGNPRTTSKDGSTATTTTTTTTTTSQAPVDTCNPNAPQPTQAGIVCHCNKWHYVKYQGSTCDDVIKFEKISADDFYKWNPAVGRDCHGLWQGYNVCVGVPGSTPISTTTQKPVQTCNPGAPQPTQAGVVCHCNKWHYVKYQGSTCDDVIKFEKISADNFYKWNPAVGRDCHGLWQGYNVCVGVPGSTPITTTTQKPVQTCNPGAPQPTQAGVACHCKRWHYVKYSGSTCDDVIKFEKISADNFYKWNPAVGRDCHGLWKDYNVCVGV